VCGLRERTRFALLRFDLEKDYSQISTSTLLSFSDFRREFFFLVWQIKRKNERKKEGRQQHDVSDD